jgi:hypothetical protein
MHGRRYVPVTSSERRTRVLVGTCVAAALFSAGCTGERSDVNGDATETTAGEPASPATIPQPAVAGDLPLAPESQRVDITMPTFSDPTNITNPLFPVSQQESVLLLGHVDDEPFRTEVTLLPETRIIEWEGQQVEVAVSQYVAFLGGSIEEVANDLYAQADDGSVWYFGEDVFDFRDGAIVVTEGTWLAGKDGPAAMIMPADPQMGDVYRPENAPGFVFEEVTVASVTETLDGPLGPIEGGLLASELHMDGSTEDKFFAPGYGEFSTSGGGDVEALALAVPTDAATGSVPPALTGISEGALSIIDAVGERNWQAAASALGEVTAGWRSLDNADVPRLIRPVMERALRSVTAAVHARRGAPAQSAAIEAARLSFDLQLRYRRVTEIDLARLDLWAVQLLVDAAAGDTEGIAADAFAMDYVRDRIWEALDEADLARVNAELGEIQIAVVDEEPEAAAEAAGRLREILAGLEPVG